MAALSITGWIRVQVELRVGLNAVMIINISYLYVETHPNSSVIRSKAQSIYRLHQKKIIFILWTDLRTLSALTNA
jgi:3-deoxy-D-manno-octulosonic acid (KDO) 8-phosphate synthase